MPLIVFEGIDGCGKTTQLNFTYDWLTSDGHDVITTRQPGCALDVCQAIAKILRSPGVSLTPLTETLLFMADRVEHIDKVILPALRENKIVLCDRWTYSTLAYQHYGRGVSKDLIDDLNVTATRSTAPDLALYYDVCAHTSLDRRKGRKNDRMESESPEFYIRVLKGYADMVRIATIHHPIADINGEQDPLSVFKVTQTHITLLLMKTGHIKI
jgi:dTMP kinase